MGIPAYSYYLTPHDNTSQFGTYEGIVSKDLIGPSMASWGIWNHLIFPSSNSLHFICYSRSLGNINTAWPRPIEGPMTADRLKERIEYAKAIRGFRNISPRFQAFIQMLKDRCEARRTGKVKKKERDEHEKYAGICDGMLMSTWEKLYGQEGARTCPQPVNTGHDGGPAPN